MTAEGGEAHVTFAAGAETDARGTDNVGTIEQCLEELPGSHTVGGAHPDIRGILTAIDLIAKGTQSGEHPLGVVHIVVDRRLYLLTAFWGVDGLGSAL